MDFGKLPSIDKVNFALPPDHPLTAGNITSKGTHTPRIYIGCPVWATREWVGKWYPQTAKEKDFLHYYARQFNTIELNTTHYRIPDTSTIQRWYEATGSDFSFCPKWPQQISHDAMLINTNSATQAFGEAISGLNEKLGSSFLQLSPAFSPAQYQILQNFIKHLSPKVPLAVEFRHPEWFTQEPEVADTFAFLRDHRVGTVLSDVAGRRDVLHMHLTTPTAMIRFVGNGLHPTDYERIDAWVIRLKQWFATGLQTVYFFVHEPDPNTFAPELAMYLAKQLTIHCDIPVKGPEPLPQVIQGTLF